MKWNVDSFQARQGGNLANLMELATFGCTFFRITSPEMCKGLVSRFGPILHYMIMQKPSLTADRFCGISLQSSGCTTTDPDSHWRIDLSQYSVVPVSIDPPATPREGNVPTISDMEPSPRRRNFANIDSTIPVRAPHKNFPVWKTKPVRIVPLNFSYVEGYKNLESTPLDWHPCGYGVSFRFNDGLWKWDVLSRGRWEGPARKACWVLWGLSQVWLAFSFVHGCTPTHFQHA